MNNTTTFTVSVDNFAAMAELTKLVNSVTGATMEIAGDKVTVTDVSGVLFAKLTGGNSFNCKETAVAGINWVGGHVAAFIGASGSVVSASTCALIDIGGKIVREAGGVVKDPAIKFTTGSIGIAADILSESRKAVGVVADSEEMARGKVVVAQAKEDLVSLWGWAKKKASKSEVITGVRILNK